MPDIKPFLVTGLALGGVYALSGVGIVVLYRATGVLNFAYGAIGAMGALISWTLINEAGIPTWPALAVAVAFGGVASLLYGVVCGPPLSGRDELVKATGTLGYALVLLGIMFLIWSDDPRTLDFPTTQYGFWVGTVRVTATQLIAIGLAVLITVLTTVYLRRARLGTAMRALANDREITATLGVPVRRVDAAAWLGSGLVCGACGVLLAAQVRLEAAALTFLVISSLAAALVGRLRSLRATLIGGLVIGLVESTLTPFTSISPYRGIIPFVIAIAVLLWLGRHRTVALSQRRQSISVGEVAARTRSFTDRVSGRTVSMRGALVAVAVALVLLALPALLDPYWVKVFQAITIYAIVAAGLVILCGRVGMISLCQIALLGVGGWVSLRLAFATDLPFEVLLLATGLITGVIGVAVGLPALRLSGLHLALVTLMAAGAITLVLNRLNFPNGGGGFRGIAEGFASTRSMPRPDLATGDSAYLRYCVIVAVILFLLAFWHLHSRAGRAWAAIRQSEASAIAAGVNVTVYKLWAFALASFMAGVAGALLAASVGQLSYFQFPTQDSVILLAAVLIGGVHSLAGAVVAGLFMRGIPAVLDTLGAEANLVLVLFGIGVVQVLLTAPRGIYGQLEDAADAVGRRLAVGRRSIRWRASP